MGATLCLVEISVRVKCQTQPYPQYLVQASSHCIVKTYTLHNVALFYRELIDTFFIVIHKKKLIFLHWYHHISVLLYCWHSYVYKAPLGILFCAMNYAVHAIMYFYYGLMALRMKPKWLNPMIITAAQISQMVVGVASTALANYLFFIRLNPETDTCIMSTENNVAALVMYGSYLFLFVQFFFGRYFVVSTTTSKSKKGSKTN